MNSFCLMLHLHVVLVPALLLFFSLHDVPFSEDCHGVCFMVPAVVYVMYTDTISCNPHIPLCPPNGSTQSCCWSIQEGRSTQSEFQSVPVESQVMCETKGFHCDWSHSPINNCYICASLSASRNS